MGDLSNNAAWFAIGAHSAIGQRRKYTGEAYYVHCREVASTVAEVGAPDEVVAAAWLHDVVEDTEVTNAQIREHFGDTVARLVDEVTDVAKPSDGSRAARKAIERAHLAKASPDGMTIKLADVLSNTRSIVQHDPGYAEVYLAEQRLLLPLLRGGNANLHAAARELLESHG